MELELLLSGWHWDLDFLWRFHWLANALRVIVHVGLAFYVVRDARTRPQLLFGTPAWFWGAIVLLSGVWGALAYWVANCSTFVQEHTVAAGHRGSAQEKGGS